MLHSYEQCKELANTRKRKLANNTYLEVHEDYFGIRLHDTEIVKYYSDHIELDSGGWRTVTTKARINEFSPVRVFQQNRVWYVQTGTAMVPYDDGISIYDDGTVVGAGPDPKETQALARKINKYARKYADEFVAGNVPKPSGGDCWYCLMVPGNHADHILSHIEEAYYVPAILNHCKDRLSMLTCDFIARMWSDDEAHRLDMSRHEWQKNLARGQISKAVRWYCSDQCGIAC